VIIDASVAFKLVVEEPGSAEAVGWVSRAELSAPSLVHAEVGNALWKWVRRGFLIETEELEERLAQLSRYLRTVDETPLIPHALRIALELGHPVYDCVYLALAEAEDDVVLTADTRLVRAVAQTTYAKRIQELGK
jgi:predicted nucleic acid-binding protein